MRYASHLRHALALSFAAATLALAPVIPAYGSTPQPPPSITADTAFPTLAAGSLLSLDDSTLLGLTTQGQVALVDDTHVIPLTLTENNTPIAPTFSALATNDNTVWGLTAAPQPELYAFTKNGTVNAHITLKGAALPTSHLSAFQIRGTTAFLVDEGSPALIVASLQTGHTQRFLTADASLIGRKALKKNGQILRNAQGIPSTGGNVRFLLQNHTQQWLFYGPACGPLYRIDPTLFTDPNFTPVEQVEGITEWWKPPSLGGIALLPDETFLMADIDHGALIAFGPSRLPSTLLTDPRLTHATAMTVLNPAPQHSVVLKIAVQTIENGVPHILRIALP
ncbi:hypothetical protein [Neokomagataea anthophila]|uniref:Phytase-like domain-containing protein n=1 Tax=Neokomagataea anthophila TaxID=2826925 RepID=A0ABS5E7Q8_9PROT|nr:hypothetical protein [Neokomagataea anthophila]MBR0559937.1 hypothetical protein [Neokomagataea anthophila]